MKEQNVDGKRGEEEKKRTRKGIRQFANRDVPVHQYPTTIVDVINTSQLFKEHYRFKMKHAVKVLTGFSFRLPTLFLCLQNYVLLQLCFWTISIIFLFALCLCSLRNVEIDLV